MIVIIIKLNLYTSISLVHVSVLISTKSSPTTLQAAAAAGPACCSTAASRSPESPRPCWSAPARCQRPCHPGSARATPPQYDDCDRRTGTAWTHSSQHGKLAGGVGTQSSQGHRLRTSHRRRRADSSGQSERASTACASAHNDLLRAQTQPLPVRPEPVVPPRAAWPPCSASCP